MKKILIAVFVGVASILLATQMIIHTTSGNETFELDQINSITFLTPSQEGKIAFDSIRDGNREIYIMNEDGTNKINLTNNPANDRIPSISPNMDLIAFCSDRSGSWELYIMNIDGSNIVQLTSNLSSDVIKGSDWINNSTLVFSPKISGVYYLYKVNTDGSNLTQLTDGSLDSNQPSVNLNSTKIYFRRNTPYNGYSSRIFSCNIDGSNVQELTTSDRREPACIIINGYEKIVFHRHYQDINQIYIMDTDGNNEINISNNQYNEATPHSGNENNLVFVSDNSGENCIWMMNHDGSNLVQLTTEEARNPYWRR